APSLVGALSLHDALPILRPRLRLFACGESLERVLDLESVVGSQIDLLPYSPIAVQIQRNLVLARLDAQSLECAVEVVDDAGVVAIDKHLRFLRLDLEADGGAGIAVI